MNITIIGTGYVGLVTGACLAEVGNNIVCVDVNETKIDNLRNGVIPIYEPSLDVMVTRNIAASRLMFSTSYATAVAHAQIIFIAVGTPSGEDGSADLSHVLECAHELGELITRDTLVVVKSTVPVGTNDRVREILRTELTKRTIAAHITTASNPEFLKEGYAVEDFMRPDRIIIGVNENATTETMKKIYAPFNRNHNRLLVMDIRSAEFTKYAANCMLAVRISFMNEMANLADCLGVDIEAVRQGIGSDPRIGSQFLYAGVGFGGSCFPKDLRALIHFGECAGEQVELLRAAIHVNTRQHRVLAAKISTFFGGNIEGKTIAIWGLAFKANTDDIREAASLVIIDALTSAGAIVRAYDPVAMTHARDLLRSNSRVMFAVSADEAVEGADVLAVITEWVEFRNPDFSWLARTLRHKAVFDGRNLYEPSAVRSAGLSYVGIGRGKV